MTRIPGILIRLVLVYPPMSMGSQVGRWMQGVLREGSPGTPYEGALLGVLLGLFVGLGLWRGAIGPMGWRSDASHLALGLLSAVWLVAVALRLSATIASEEALIAYALALLGGSVVLAVVR